MRRIRIVSVAALLATSVYLVLHTKPTRGDESHLQSPETTIRHASKLVHGWGPAEVYVDPSFSTEQQNLIKKAAAVLQERILRRHVFRMAMQKSTKDLPGGLPNGTKPSDAAIQDARAKIVRQLEILGGDFDSNVNQLTKVGWGGPQVKIHIARIWSVNNAVGKGFVGIVDVKKNVPVHRFAIALNSDYMTSTFVHGQNPEYWAGVIAHECLHNLGYQHPTGYEGSFINEFGNVIWTCNSGPQKLSDPLGKKAAMPTSCCGDHQ